MRSELSVIDFSGYNSRDNSNWQLLSSGRDISQVFHDLIPKRALPDYYKVIKHPQAMNPVQVSLATQPAVNQLSLTMLFNTDFGKKEKLFNVYRLCEGLRSGTKAHF